MYIYNIFMSEHLVWDIFCCCLRLNQQASFKSARQRNCQLDGALEAII